MEILTPGSSTQLSAVDYLAAMARSEIGTETAHLLTRFPNANQAGPNSEGLHDFRQLVFVLGFCCHDHSDGAFQLNCQSAVSVLSG